MWRLFAVVAIITQYFFISGVDSASSTTGRSDMNMVVGYNHNTNEVILLSIPRDAYVKNPCIYNRYDKLTHTFNCGIDNTIRVIENLLDIQISNYAQFDFQDIISCIDELGGLPYDVPFDFKEYDENHKLIYIKKGYQTLTGKEVLALARHRKGLLYGDYARCANTQDIIKVLIKEYLSISSISKLIKLAENIRTDIEYDELFNLLYDAASKPLTINSYVIQGTGRNKETASIIGIPLSVIVLENNSVNKAKYLLENIKEIDLSTLHYNINFYLDTIPSTIKQ
ncbi:MAG: LCP family protein [Erysipelotrichales bacterium]|nr:LCP family protein [Erysipelotrichales bacterium]